MLIRKGISVSPGVAIARAVVLDVEDQPVPRRAIAAAQVEAENLRLRQALDASWQEIDELRAQTESRLGAELAKIFSFHQVMLQDASLIQQIEQVIEGERVTAEYAAFSVLRRQAQVLAHQEDSLFRDRVRDLYDIERRILRHLIGERQHALDQLKVEAIVLAHDLTPSQTASLDKAKIKGLVTDAGGRTSHTAILAHALGIPAIVGCEDLTGQVASGQTVIVDAHNGVVVVDPDAGQLMEYRAAVARRTALDASLNDLATLPAVTTDGTTIDLWANIEFPSEIPGALAKGATGIGLYRTEFLYLASEYEPTEEQQFEAYRQSLRLAAGRPLTIRTLDLGADKMRKGQPAQEPNPFLGCRSIRLCLQDLPLFKTQLRAILRASAEGPLRVMFPMISSVMELRQARMVMGDVMEDLEEEGLPFGHDLKVGMMVEVPAAALQAEVFAHEVDFFSLGTNDLVQYTVAVDRGNEHVAGLYSAGHPAVLALLREVVRASNRAGKELSLCGEMAGDPIFIPLLLGLGLRRLSMTPPAIPAAKRLIRALSLAQCQRIARKVASFDSDREVVNYLQNQLERILPEDADGRSIES